MSKRKNTNKLNLKQLIVVILIITAVEFIGYFSSDAGASNNVATTISFNINEIPEYNGQAYVMINNNMPNFTEEDYTTEAFEKYSELDYLGRCGVAYANICMEIMPIEGEKRTEIGAIKPSGWHTTRYDDLISDKYLYNRCHLIGWQLAGENANAKNLITGTRYMNVEGMLPFENIVDDYIEQNEKNHVLYRVTPIFEGENLVASGVQMEAYSVEDQGEGVCFNVYVYNVQPGIEIDYTTGNSKKVEN